jgi:hypothetical protein
VHAMQLGPPSVSSIFEGIRGYWNESEQRVYLFQLSR